MERGTSTPTAWSAESRFDAGMRARRGRWTWVGQVGEGQRCAGLTREWQRREVPVAMVHVDVDIQDTRIESEQLEDGENNVVDVAEA